MRAPGPRCWRSSTRRSGRPPSSMRSSAIASGWRPSGQRPRRSWPTAGGHWPPRSSSAMRPCWPRSTPPRTRWPRRATSCTRSRPPSRPPDRSGQRSSAPWRPAPTSSRRPAGRSPRPSGGSRDERARATAGAGERAALEAALGVARDEHRAAIEAELGAASAVDRTRAAAEGAEGARRAADEVAAAVAEALAAVRARLAAATARSAEDEERGIARAARRGGGRRVDAQLQVEPAFGPPSETSPRRASRGLRRLRRRPSAAWPANEAGSSSRSARPATPAPLAFLEVLARAGGGQLVEAVRRDDVGAARAILARTAWVPDLASALECPGAPPGRLADRRPRWQRPDRCDQVALGRTDGTLERRAEIERLEAEGRPARSRGWPGRVGPGRGGRSEPRRRAPTMPPPAPTRLGSVPDGGRRRKPNASRRGRRASRPGGGLARSGRPAGGVGAGPASRPPWRRSKRPTRRVGDAGRDVGRRRLVRPWRRPEASAIEAWESRVAELRTRRDELAGELAERDRLRAEGEARSGPRRGRSGDEPGPDRARRPGDGGPRPARGGGRPGA